MRMLPLLLLGPLAFGQTAPNALTPAEKAAGWKLLFDGRTMNGWSKPHFESWAIEDGSLKSLPKPTLREDLISAGTFEDFELAFEWKVAPGANSGVKYKIQETVLVDAQQLPDPKMRFEDQVAYELANRQAKYEKVARGHDAQVYPVAFEYQMIDDGAHPDAVGKAESRAGALYSMVAPSQAAARPVGEWNQARIVVRGLTAEHWLNGVKVVETRLDAPAVRAQIEKRWAKAQPVRDLLVKLPKKSCPISLQHHNDVAWFRSIKIRAL